ncbi:MAG: transcriptional repressor [Bacteroidales bacterium]|nr:transcriptional repressor [Bacteroidales bacterium]MCB8998593.1 transcriptional repressor [Bacteroidales bacterium]MCB9012539.1 transcriptional repressor [Bacteroidales bacterium]
MNYKEVLKQSKLSLTSHRIELLKILATRERALSEKEIEGLMRGNCNRTTIYRNLNSLVEKKLVHRILSEEAVKYKLIAVNQNNSSDPDHVHFECTNCNTTYCMEELEIKDFELPDGFQKTENQFIILGICKNCHYENS